MSTIKANDIQNASGGIPTVKGQRLIPTAWVNFNGTGTVAIRDSENVSSISDNGTGDYTVNFGTAMANNSYNVVCGNGMGAEDSAGRNFLNIRGSATQLTASTRLICIWAGDGALYQDVFQGHVTILGGQA